MGTVALTDTSTTGGTRVYTSHLIDVAAYGDANGVAGSSYIAQKGGTSKVNFAGSGEAAADVRDPNGSIDVATTSDITNEKVTATANVNAAGDGPINAVVGSSASAGGTTTGSGKGNVGISKSTSTSSMKSTDTGVVGTSVSEATTKGSLPAPVVTAGSSVTSDGTKGTQKSKDKQMGLNTPGVQKVIWNKG